jgi:hypothetical protein
MNSGAASGEGFRGRTAGVKMGMQKWHARFVKYQMHLTRTVPRLQRSLLFLTLLLQPLQWKKDMICLIEEQDMGVHTCIP